MFSIEEFKTKKDQIRKQQEELQKNVTEIFSNGVKELFDQYPGLLNIMFVQYTPYFNDGDACEFGVGEFYVNSRDVWDDEPLEELYTEEELEARANWTSTPDERWIKKYSCVSPERKTQFEAAEKAARDFLILFDEDDYLFMFGDHVSVTITKDGINVEDYDHD